MQSAKTVVGVYKGHAWPAPGGPQGARTYSGYFHMPSQLITRTDVILEKNDKKFGIGKLRDSGPHKQ